MFRAGSNNNTYRGKPRGFGAPSKVDRHCYLCENKINHLDYKDIQLLRRFMSPHAKILGSKRTGTCRVHQRVVQKALKRARHMALLPFVPQT